MMNMDFDAIKTRLDKLTRSNSRRNSIWRPKGEHNIRIVPVSENPFEERWFYYFLEKGSIVAPGPTFGKADPIAELRDKLYQEDSDASKTQARAIRPKMRVYVPVVVRGEEDSGVRWWGISKTTYEQILRIILDEDFQNPSIMDVKSGHDLRVSWTKGTETTFPKTTVRARPKPTPLSTDSEQVQKWLSETPDINDIFEPKSYDELSQLLNDWLSGPVDEDKEIADGGASDTNISDEDLENTFSELDNVFNKVLNEEQTQ